jgi:hypothetical protein
MRFSHIYSLCSCSYRRWGTHKQHNNLKWASKLFQFQVFEFFLFQVICFMLSCFKFLCLYIFSCSFLGFLGVWFKQKKLPQPPLNLSSSKLRSFKRGQSKNICIRPPTFGAKNWRPNAKQIVFGMFKIFWKAVEYKKSTLGLQLSMPKVGGRKYFFLPLSLSCIPWARNLGPPWKAKHIFFCLASFGALKDTN